MLNLKKVGLLGVAAFASVSLVGKVSAETYYRINGLYSGIQELTINGTESPQLINNEANIGDIYLETVDQYQEYNSSSNLRVAIKGYNFVDETTYTVTLGSSSVQKTGEQMNNGISVDVIGASGEISLVITEPPAAQINYGKYTCDNAEPNCTNSHLEDSSSSTRYGIIRIHLPEINTNYVPTEEEVAAMDAVFAKIAPGGVISVNTIDPWKSNVNEFMRDSLVSAALDKMYGSLGYEFQAMPYEDGSGSVDIIYHNFETLDSFSKSYEVTFKYLSIDSNIKSITDEISNLIKQNREEVNKDFYKRYIIEDLDSINYYYSVQRTKNPYMAIYSIPSYSTKLQEKIGNKNIDFMFDPRAGDNSSEFHKFVLGAVNVLYNGQVYSNVDPVGFALTNVLYIDSDTPKNDEAFIAAAKSRIESYLKGVTVEIDAVGAIDPTMEGDYSWDHTDDGLTPFIDLDKTTGSVYNITIGDMDYMYFIVADSEKQITPAVKTLDMKSNVYMMTDSFETPLDSKLYANKLDKNSAEYKTLAKKLNIIQGLAYDLNLYSNSLDMYIEKLTDGKFKVYIPVDEATTKKKLTAVYIKEDGTLESHPVTFEGNYAVFETDHFSTYALVDSKNPKTGDHLVLYLLVLTASGYALYKARKFN